MRYRHAWPGFLLLTTLAVLLVSLLVWGDHLLTPSPAGGIRRLLQLWPAASITPGALQPSVAEVAAALPADPGDPAAPASDPPEGPPPEGTPRERHPPEPAPAARPGRPVSPLGSQFRYALDLGTFAVDEDAEGVEAQLNQAGFSTVRFRQPAPARLFTVSVGPAGDAQPTATAIEPLKPGGLAQTATGQEDGGSVPVAQALPLRSAVRLAERLRAAGHAVRILAEATSTAQITLRHGNFASREEAESVGREISRLGVANEVVQVR